MTKRFTLKWTITKNNVGMLVRDFLYKKEISKKSLTKIKYNGGQILVNDEEVTVRYELQIGDKLIVKFPEEKQSSSLVGENIALEIIYEDDYLLVINKDPYMNTIPSREHPTGSVANGLINYYNTNDIKATAHIVTRLDRDTSGLLLIAKHRHIHHLLSKQLKKGKIHRQYEAFVRGQIKRNSGTIEKRIARKETSIIEREVNDKGQYACTHYKTIRLYDNFSHVQLVLETGRTHQIRVHLAYLGHPLLGDDLYGDTKTEIDRQALHCNFIQFVHPITNKVTQFKIALPEDMITLTKM